MTTEALILEKKNVLITGTTRGVGARSAVAFAEAGADIVGTFANPDPKSSKRQDRTIKACQVVNPNLHFTSIRTDITVADDRRAMIEAAVGGSLSNPTRKIDVLILNAAGGLEEGKGEDWADIINHRSQLAIVEEALPYFAPGAKIIYMQSLWGHYFGKTRQLAIYESVARTKNAAESDLRSKVVELSARDISLGILVADIIEGTSVFSLFKKMLGEGFLKIAEQIPGGFPTVDGVAREIVRMASTRWESGYTSFIGRKELEPFDESAFGKVLTRPELASKLPMYADSSLYVDSFKITGRNSGEAEYTVREKEWIDHFDGPYGDIKVEPGHFVEEFIAQASGLTVEGTRIIGTGAPLLQGVSYDLWGMVYPGERIKAVTKIIRTISGGIVCSAELFGQNGALIGKYDRVKFQILPTYEIAKRVYRRQRFERGMAPAGEVIGTETED